MSTAAEPATGLDTFGDWIDLLAAGIEHGPEAYASGARDGKLSGRPPEDRRAYATDPWGYFRDILDRRTLTGDLARQMDEAIDVLYRNDRVLMQAGTNLTKTFVLGGMACWRYDALAALADAEGEEQGCILLLVGPDHKVIKDTIWGEISDHANRAESRGHIMPAGRTASGWRTGPKWFMQTISPPKGGGGINVKHAVSGRHQRNMAALFEEIAQLEEGVWAGIEGGLSGEGNAIWAAFNPTEPRGPAYERARSGVGWKVHVISALDHPNVRTRSAIIPAAVSFRKIDERVEADCVALGTPAEREPDPQHHDFLYAVPPPGAEERGPREDGLPGHPDGEVLVWRPSGLFTPQVLGQFPAESISGLFHPAAWDAAVERWKAERDPDRPPDRVGVDCAREGDDSNMAAPAWGRSAEALLRAWREIRSAAAGTRAPREPAVEHVAAARIDELAEWLGSAEVDRLVAEATAIPPPKPGKLSAEEALENVKRRHRTRIGRLVVGPKGDGPTVAAWLAERWKESPFLVDDSGVGASIYDHLTVVMLHQATGVCFGGAARPALLDEPACENLRSQMYWRAAQVVNLGLVNVPPDAFLREEVMAHRSEWRRRPVSGRGRRDYETCVWVESKEAVKARIGRSPDRADAFVQALLEPVRWELS